MLCLVFQNHNKNHDESHTNKDIIEFEEGRSGVNHPDKTEQNKSTDEDFGSCSDIW